MGFLMLESCPGCQGHTVVLASVGLRASLGGGAAFFWDVAFLAVVAFFHEVHPSHVPSRDMDACLRLCLFEAHFLLEQLLPDPPAESWPVDESISASEVVFLASVFVKCF